MRVFSLPFLRVQKLLNVYSFFLQRIMFPIHEPAGVIDESSARMILKQSLEGFDRAGLPPMERSSVAAGDYAVVEVTEVKGHTLRGKLLWKSTLAGFADMESNQLSKIGDEGMARFRTRLEEEIGTDLSVVQQRLVV